MYSNQKEILHHKYFSLINKQKYILFGTVNFKQVSDTSIDKNINHFLKVLHKGIFGSSFKENDKYLNMFIVVESINTIYNLGHFHFLLSYHPHSYLNYQQIINGFVYATNHCLSMRSIITSKNSYDTDILKINHCKLRGNTKILKKMLQKYNNPEFPFNLIQISTKQDQEKIIKYMLKCSIKNNFQTAFLNHDDTDYFNFKSNINTIEDNIYENYLREAI